MKSLGAKCVFASDINIEAQKVYKNNFGITPNGDIKRLRQPTYQNTILSVPDFHVNHLVYLVVKKVWIVMLVNYFMRLLELQSITNRKLFF